MKQNGNNLRFTLKEEREMAEVGGLARLWRHDKTGAEVLSIINKDENKCFGISFYTPPTDSTGIAHILEHSVLCGSRKYPVKEPFVELLKGSLQTFLNAFTFPDKTCYPVASCNLADFYNLIDVYIDAVFHPLLNENIFRQEGWHIEAADTQANKDDGQDSQNAGQWSYKGVVYNEMKGVYSSADSILAEKSQQAIFPDNLYSLDSGGNPENITDLTFRQFKDFHNRYYQPGNAKFFFWGDDPEEERLKIVANALENANPGDGAPMPDVKLQKKFVKPVVYEERYPAQENDDRAMFTLTWLLPERGNIQEALKMEMLSHILEGLPGSPLRRALIESGLGEDTAGCGLETDLRQMYYSTGLKGVKKENIDKAEQIIIDTLKKLAEEGIEQDAIDAAVNSIEFAYRENNSGRFPRGLAAMVSALSTWNYGGDPLAPLFWEKPLANIKRQLANGEKIFEKAIREYFLENPSSAKVVLLPDNELPKQREKRERAKLKALFDKATEQDKKNVIKETELLQKAQGTPDSEEDLAKIPSLKVEEIVRENPVIPTEIDNSQPDQTYLLHDLPTNGILYSNILFPIKKIKPELIPYLPLFCRMLTECGTKNLDFAQLGKKIAAKTGGITAGVNTETNKAGDPLLFLSLQGRAVYSNQKDLFELFQEILLEPQTEPEVLAPRLMQMVLENRAQLEFMLQTAGHAAVISRLGARFRTESMLGELMSGISQLRFINELFEKLQNNPAEVLANLKTLRKSIIGSKDLIIDLAAEQRDLKEAKNLAQSLIKELPKETPVAPGIAIKDIQPGTDLPENEAFLTPGQINFVGQGANLYDLGYEYSGTANVIMRWLRMGRLWEDVRVSGGAYGVFASFNRKLGNLVFASYRDPNVDQTLESYNSLGDYLRNFNPTDKQLSQAIIGAISDLDTYLLPDAKAARALQQYLRGDTKESLQKMRDEILNAKAEDFKKFADILDKASKNSAICVVGGSKTEEAADKHGWDKQPLN